MSIAWRNENSIEGYVQATKSLLLAQKLEEKTLLDALLEIFTL